MSDKKAINVMYQQQLSHLPNTIKRKALTSILKTIKELLEPEKYAGIIHNKDDTEEHVHVIMQFKNQRSINNLAKLMNEETTQAFTAWKGNVNNGYCYLIHRTDKAKDKHQYDISEVLANFDYAKLIESISEKMSKKSSMQSKQFIDNLLDLLGAGEISKSEMITQLTGSQYAKNKTLINNAWQGYLEEHSKIWKEERKTNNTELKVIWIFGAAGTAKSTLAKKYAAELCHEYFISGSSRDMFQQYEGQAAIILDDLRPETFPYDDLLKMLDPFGEAPAAPSRYFDKLLTADIFIITSPYNPRQFYDKIFTTFEDTDSFGQLARRITITQFVSEQYFEMQKYVPLLKTYAPVNNTRKENIFLKELKKRKKIDSLDLFSKMNEFAPDTKKDNISQGIKSFKEEGYHDFKY